MMFELNSYHKERLLLVLSYCEYLSHKITLIVTQSLLKSYVTQLHILENVKEELP